MIGRIIAVFILSMPFHCYAESYKEAIASQLERIEAADQHSKGVLLKELAILYLKDQDQEHAFESFLESLQYAAKRELPKMSEADQKVYEEALAQYFSNQAPTENAKEIIKKYGAVLKDHPQNHLLGYLVALAYANLNKYGEFFEHFFGAYEYFPEHFLAYKTKGILHIKLMERKRTDEEKQAQREIILMNFNRALEKEPRDTTLYKLLITFSSPEKRGTQVLQCLNKIIAENIIIPRSEIIFYVQLAMDAKEETLAQRFVDKAKQWYPQSRIMTAAQNFIDTHKSK